MYRSHAHNAALETIDVLREIEEARPLPVTRAEKILPARRDLDELCALCEERKLRPVVDRVFRLEELAAACPPLQPAGQDRGQDRGHRSG